VGKHVTIKINGETSVDDDFPKMPDEGIIAWQLHAGFKSMEVIFKDIKFKDLSAKKEEKKESVKGKATFKGKPINGAMMTFYPADGTGDVIKATLNAEGAFVLDAPKGTYRVTFTW